MEKIIEIKSFDASKETLTDVEGNEYQLSPYYDKVEFEGFEYALIGEIEGQEQFHWVLPLETSQSEMFYLRPWKSLSIVINYNKIESMAFFEERDSFVKTLKVFKLNELLGYLCKVYDLMVTGDTIYINDKGNGFKTS